MLNAHEGRDRRPPPSWASPPSAVAWPWPPGAGTTTRPTRRSPAPTLDKASAAALEHTGEGRVTETEVGDEESLLRGRGDPRRRRRRSTCSSTPTSRSSATSGTRTAARTTDREGGGADTRPHRPAIRWVYSLVYSRSVNVPLTLLGLLEPEPSTATSSSGPTTIASVGKPLPFGQVYATLGRLERDGRVEVLGIEPGAGPERKRYAITPRA